MGFYDAIRIGASGAASAYEIERSLRFNSSDNTYLAKTPSSTTSRTTWTYSTWIKKTSFGSTVGLFGTQGSDNNTNTELLFTSANKFSWSAYSKVYFTTTQVFRDPSAWFHLLVRCDTTNSTQADRIQLWLNGSRVTSFATENLTGSGTEFGINRNVDHRIGERPGGSDNFNGYLAEMHFVDGTALDSSSFTETDSDTGQLIPKKYVGSYGTNGFYLNFSDNSGTTATTLGKDSSGNGNNFTPNNFATGDAVKDSPTNNFAIWNIVDAKGKDNTFSEGNLKTVIAYQGSDEESGATFAVSSGKWYWEEYMQSSTGNASNVGVGVKSVDNGNFWRVRGAGGESDHNGSQANVSGLSWVTGDIIGILLDLDDGSWKVSKNGTLIDVKIHTNVSGTVTPTMHNSNSSENHTFITNFGQDSSFAGTKTAQGNTDGSGQGDFHYSVPSGYKALCSANLPDPTILLPNKHFDTLLYTGNGSGQTLSGLNFSPDWLWIKSRSSTEPHELNDQVRGTLKSLSSNSTAAENTASGRIEAFTSDGFTVGNSGNVNSNSETFVAWNWDAGETDSKTYTVTVVSDSGNKYRFDGYGTSAVTLDLAEGGTYIFNYPSAHPLKFSTTADGTHGGGSEYTTGVTHNTSTQVTIVVAASAPTLYYYCSIHSGMGGAVNTNSTLGSSNFAGSIQSTVKVNASAGFSIVTFSGSGNRTIGHGLGVAPQVIIMKGRNVSDQWTVGHQQLDASNPWHKGIPLNTSASTQDNATFWNDTAPTSTVFSKGSWNENYNMIAYCFSEVAGYSKFGKYTGNGNADGTFVFTGFRPAWIMYKSTSASESWQIKDSKRVGYNDQNHTLFANNSNVEYTTALVDFLSNGFKFRVSDGGSNGSSESLIYLAFAESPFKNARAR